MKSKALLGLLGLLLASCIDTRTAPVDYGAQVDPNAILEALNKPVENLSAANIQVGEFVAMRTTQDLAYGASFSVVGDTGVTITDRNEDANKVVYSGVLHDLAYQQDGSYTKTSKEGEILCASKVACACGECGDQSASATTTNLASDPLAPAMQAPTVVTKAGRSQNLLKNMTYTSPLKLVTQAAAAAPVPTFHRFSTYKTSQRPPGSTSTEPNCLGIPGCMIDVYHVTFDEIFWDSPQGNKYHIEAQLSPDVPYLSRNMSTCQSVLVNVGTSGSNVLLKQCSYVFDFRFHD